MKIYGLQKMTLLDYPGRIACTVFLNGCSFRCPFCHNFELVEGSAPPVMEEEAFFSFLSKRQGLLEGVAVSGGEPCLHPDLPEFLRKIRDLGFQVKLDTNGFHPEMLKEVLDSGLADYVAMDVKNSLSKYALTAGVPALDPAPVLSSILLLKEGTVDYEFRTTVVREFHETGDFREIGEMISGARRYFLQSFTDRETVPAEGLHPLSPEELEICAENAREFVSSVQIRGV